LKESSGNNLSFEKLSDQHRGDIIETSLQTIVMYMASLTSVYTSIGLCKAGDASSASNTNDQLVNASHDWDEAVAYWSGSFENSSGSGTDRDNGFLLYALAYDLCDDFENCVDEEAKNNIELLALFMEGRQHILDGNCDELEKLGPKIEALLLIPLIQGTLYYASKKEGVFGFDDSGNFGKVGSELDTAAAFALAASILPYVDYVNYDAAKVIANIMMSPSCLKMIVIPMVPWCTNRIRIVSQCLIRLLGLHQRRTLSIVAWLVL